MELVCPAGNLPRRCVKLDGPAGKQSGAGTWRCKECHGWDYRGRDGAYGKGGHYTGIKGIQAHAGGSPETVFAILKDANHQYDRVMLDPALKLLARFVSAMKDERVLASKRLRGPRAKRRADRDAFGGGKRRNRKSKNS